MIFFSLLKIAIYFFVFPNNSMSFCTPYVQRLLSIR